LSRFPPPAAYKPGVYTAPPTKVAVELARLYGQTFGPPPGVQVRQVGRKGLAFPELGGVLEWPLLRMEFTAPGGGPPRAVQVWGPLPPALDAARNTLALAVQYAPADYAGFTPEHRKRVA